jgi:Fe2+ transport system protein B
MGTRMFENQMFDHWLNQKSQEILSRIDKERVSTEDMLILSLKAQTNHFHHMDVEFREEFRKIDKRFESLDQRFSNSDDKLDKRFNSNDERLDKRFDRLITSLYWGFGILITSVFGLYIKLFLG